MKSLNIDAVIPWEIGLVIIVCGFVLIFLGTRQSKKEFDIENLELKKEFCVNNMAAVYEGIHLSSPQSN